MNVGSIPARDAKDYVMYKINDKEFKTLDDAMKYAKIVNTFVVISGGGMEICGKFGVDEIVDGKTPDGFKYEWVKRRQAMRM